MSTRWQTVEGGVTRVERNGEQYIRVALEGRNADGVKVAQMVEIEPQRWDAYHARTMAFAIRDIENHGGIL